LYNIEGVGFIDSLHGWAGGGFGYSFETQDGGQTWDTIHVLEVFNRFFKLNDTMVFAAGWGIWKYTPNLTGIQPQPASSAVLSTLNVSPNPVNDVLTVHWSLAQPTRAMLTLYDAGGRPVRTIENALKPKGKYEEQVNTAGLAAGTYLLVLKTHEDKRAVQVVVMH
jgi:hypothetical protein